MKNKGFTLIEMLVVVVLIGIVLAIAIPSAQRLINGQSKQKYETHMDIVESAAKLYTDKHKGELADRSTTCFNLNYDVLKTEGLEESDVFCSGSIIITKTENNNSFDLEYYLDCKDKNDKVLSTKDTVPTNCKEIN